MSALSSLDHMLLCCIASQCSMSILICLVPKWSHSLIILAQCNSQAGATETEVEQARVFTSSDMAGHHGWRLPATSSLAGQFYLLPRLGYDSVTLWALFINDSLCMVIHGSNDWKITWIWITLNKVFSRGVETSSLWLLSTLRGVLSTFHDTRINWN